MSSVKLMRTGAIDLILRRNFQSRTEITLISLGAARHEEIILTYPKMNHTGNSTKPFKQWDVCAPLTFYLQPRKWIYANAIISRKRQMGLATALVLQIDEASISVTIKRHPYNLFYTRGERCQQMRCASAAKSRLLRAARCGLLSPLHTRSAAE